MSHRCLVGELQRFPILRKRMEEVVNSFLREGLSPAESMISHLIDMEVIVSDSIILMAQGQIIMSLHFFVCRCMQFYLRAAE